MEREKDKEWLERPSYVRGELGCRLCVGRVVHVGSRTHVEAAAGNPSNDRGRPPSRCDSPTQSPRHGEISPVVSRRGRGHYPRHGRRRRVHLHRPRTGLSLHQKDPPHSHIVEGSYYQGVSNGYKSL